MAPLKAKVEVALFCVTLVTLEPMTELIVVVPLPVPELVIEPTWLTLPPERARPPVEFACSARLPVPVTPPLIVSRLLLAFEKLWLTPSARGALIVLAPAPDWTARPGVFAPDPPPMVSVFEPLSVTPAVAEVPDPVMVTLLTVTLPVLSVGVVLLALFAVR